MQFFSCLIGIDQYFGNTLIHHDVQNDSLAYEIMGGGKPADISTHKKVSFQLKLINLLAL